MCISELNIAEHSPDELEDLVLRHGFSTQKIREGSLHFPGTGEEQVRAFHVDSLQGHRYAESLRNRIVSEDFRDGYYSERVALVHSKELGIRARKMMTTLRN